MGTTYPLDGYVVGTSTVWGTNVDRDGTYSVIGSYSVKFTSDGATGFTLSESEKFACYPGEPFAVDGWYRSDTTGNVAHVNVAWYTAADVYISTTDVSGTYYLAAAVADTWYRVSDVITAPATAAKGLLFFGNRPDMTSGKFAWFDSILIHRMPVCFKASKTADQTLTTGVLTVITSLDDTTAGNYDHGNNFASSAFTAPSTGIYSFWGGSQFKDLLGDGDEAAIFLNVNSGTLYAMHVAWLGKAGAPWIIGQRNGILLSAGDVVELAVQHNYGSDRDIDNATFSGFRIQ